MLGRAAEYWYLGVFAIAAWLLATNFWGEYRAIESLAQAQGAASPPGAGEFGIPEIAARDSQIKDLDISAIGDPFDTQVKPSRQAPSPRPSASLQFSRNFRLTGILNESSAILADTSGRTHIVGPGDSISGARVVRLESDRIWLSDASGSFAITLEP